MKLTEPNVAREDAWAKLREIAAESEAWEEEEGEVVNIGAYEYNRTEAKMYTVNVGISYTVEANDNEVAEQRAYEVLNTFILSPPTPLSAKLPWWSSRLEIKDINIQNTG